MKKAIGFLVIIFAAIISYAYAFNVIGSKKTVGAEDCPASGTWLYYWDGDHSSGDTYVCYDDGADINGTESGTPIGAGGYSGNGMNITANDQGLQWAGSLHSTKGTFWVLLKVANADLGDTWFMGFFVEDGSNECYIWMDNDGTMKGYWEGSGSTVSGNWEPYYDNDTWQWVGYAYDKTPAAGSEDLAVYGENDVWDESGSVTLTDMTTYSGNFEAGNVSAGGTHSVSHHLDSWYYFDNVYQASMPFSLSYIHDMKYEEAVAKLEKELKEVSDNISARLALAAINRIYEEYGDKEFNKNNRLLN